MRGWNHSFATPSRAQVALPSSINREGASHTPQITGKFRSVEIAKVLIEITGKIAARTLAHRKERGTHFPTMALATHTNTVDAPEVGGRIRTGAGAAPRASMSQRLWDIDWKSVLPCHFGDVRVEYERLADVLPFMADVFPQTFNVGCQWFQEEMTEAKRRFGEEMDVFVFRAEAKIVGVIVAHPSDWSTYYWRITTILPEYRKRNLVVSFGSRLYALFREVGVKRMEVDTSPANRAMVRLLGNEGFIVTSTSTSERWGLCLRFTKFLDDEAERVYRRQFLDVPENPITERS